VLVDEGKAPVQADDAAARRDTLCSLAGASL
jgi:hypothetical protein